MRSPSARWSPSSGPSTPAIRPGSSRLVVEREALYAAIEARVDAMVAAGAVDEVRAAHAAGASMTARKAIGFEELLRDDVEAMKTETRRYAKRQLTWLRKLPGTEVVDVTGRGRRCRRRRPAALTVAA